MGITIRKFFSVEFWLITGGVGLSFISESALLPICAIGAAFITGRLIFSQFERTPVDFPILIIVAAGAVSLLVSARPAQSSVQVFRLWSGVLLFYAIVHWLNAESRLRWISAGFLLGGLGLFVFSFVGIEWNQAKLPFLPASIYEPFRTIVSDTVNPNVLAGSLLVFLVFFVQGLLWTNLRAHPLLWLSFGAGAVLLTGTLILSQSRGALLAASLAVILLGSMRWRRGWVLFVFLGISLVWGASFLGADRLLDLLFSGQQFDGFRGRENIWSRGIFMLKDFSFTGIGMGLFWDVVSRIYPLGPVGSTAVMHVHNLFLQVGIDLGIPGLVAWLSVYFAGLALSWNLYRIGKKNADSLYAGLGAGFFALQIAIGIHGVFDAVIWGMVRTAPLLWAVWGAAVGSWILATRKQTEKQP